MSTGASARPASSTDPTAAGARGGCAVAHCRTNLRALADRDAADRFLAEYESLTGRTYDWFWEMASILERDPGHWTPAQLAESEPLLARAVAELAPLPGRNQPVP